MSSEHVRGALKYLKNNRDNQARGRMRREVVTLETLSALCDSVPKVLDHNTDSFDGNAAELYVVMELIEGPTLSEYVEASGPLSIEDACAIIRSIGKTLKIAHEAEVLHRDLKPDNIIVRGGNKHDLVVVDYGLSFNRHDEDLTEIDETFRNRFLDLPETNTPNGDRRDYRSDITALVAIFYFCITKHRIGQLHDGTQSPPHLRTGYSVREVIPNDGRLTFVEAFLTKGLTLNIANRFQSMSELEQELKNIESASPEYDQSDPVKVAAMLGLQLREGDRKTQLAAHRGQAELLFKFVMQEIHKIQNKTPPFKCAFVGAHISQKLEFPAEFDFVSQSHGTIAVTLDNHDCTEFRLLVVLSTGEQCVLFPYEASIKGSRVNPVWVRQKEIVRFTGDVSAVYPLVKDELLAWVVKSMHRLRDEALR